MINKFDELVKDLKDETIRLCHIKTAYRAYIREADHIPGEIKDLLCGKEDSSGLIGRCFDLLDNMIGSMELAARRGRLNK